MSEVAFLMCCGLLTTTLLMFVIWLVSQRINNAGIVDVAWGFGFFIVAVVYFRLANLHGWGNFERTSLILAMVSIWSVRLGLFLALRFKRMWPEEDGRYKKFRQDWGSRAPLGLFLAFEMQAILLAALTLPFAIAMTNSNNLGNTEIVAAVIYLLSVIGEALSDHQLESFKANNHDRTAVCQIGFWNYSRHPNYFFEWMVWVSFFIFSLASPNGIYTAYCPLLMLFFLLKVTGVKATEEQTVRTKGQAYIDYQLTTSAFVPWFKKRKVQ